MLADRMRMSSGGGEGGEGVFAQTGRVMLGSATSITINLSTPVAVGKSFAICTTCSSNADLPIDILVKAELITVVDGKYTQLRLTRGRGLGENVETLWQVISGDSFKVQSGTLNTSGVHSDIFTTSIDKVDPKRTFIITSMSVATVIEFRRVVVNATLESPTEIAFRKPTLETLDSRIQYYVVEFFGASVQHGTGNNNTSATQIVDINTVDPQNTFAIIHQMSGSSAQQTLFNYRINADGKLELRNGGASGAGGINFSYFVVSHPKIRVREIFDTLEWGVLGRAVSISPHGNAQSFIAHNFLGNGRISYSGTSFWRSGIHIIGFSHSFLSSIIFRRGDDFNSTLRASAQIVEWIGGN